MISKLKIAMNAGAKAIEDNKRLREKIYMYDYEDDGMDMPYTEAAFLLRTSHPPTPWISVDDRMPIEYEVENDKILDESVEPPEFKSYSMSKGVDVVIKNLETGERFISSDRTVDREWDIFDGKGHFSKCVITHWMPQRELPEEETNG